MSAGRPARVDEGYVDSLRRWVVASGDETAAAIAPFTGEPLPEIPQSSAADVAEAAARGRVAQEVWAARPLSERIAILVRFAQLVLKERDRLIDVVQWETGKSRVHATIELLGLPAVTAHYASNAASYLGEHRAASGTPGVIRTRVAHRPKGLVGVIARNIDDGTFEELLSHIPLPDQRKKWATARSGFSEADLANATDKIVYALTKIEKQLGETAYLAGDSYTLADINFFAHCGAMVDRMFPELNVDATYPKLAAWRETVKARPAVKEALASEDRTAPGLRTWSGDR